MGYLSCKAESAVSVISASKTTQNSSSKADTNKHEKPIKIQQFDYCDLEAATNGFSDRRLLGKGSHGAVYKAVLKGRHVAIKRPSSRNQETGHETDNEIEILSKIRSPRLVNLLGFSNDARDRLLVVEFMSNGTLYDVLHYNSSRPLNWGRRIRLALQVAKALETLHSQKPPIIHRDVKSANVLIDGNFNAKLGDFGLALRCVVDDYKLRSTPPAGTMGYIDPCYVTPDNLSTKTDVFSFGILLLEIISGRKAIDVAHSPPSINDWAIPLVKKGNIVAVYDRRISPPKDPIVRKQLAVIAAKCVRSYRERRPTMNEVVGWLTGISKLVPLHTWNGFNNPCMMVETMGRPVESRNVKESSDAVDGTYAAKDSRRVYSDLGFRSNLMELMGITSIDEAEADASCTHRFDNKRYGNQPRGQHKNIGNENSVFGLRRNHSAGEGREPFSGEGDVFSRSCSTSQAVGDI
ncbi:Serine/threonine-protein kinase-like protein [Hibiscus syriacus]|uniref:Serine/threonine-protein kinase-like protein n=1 Tax=Hibiscus syriacus TaxID=106335 RepID=A0A6A3CE45_HIBSY|nr:serine/threonine-protein kinase-like protein At3g51990 [Hibiscus syriacus]KAE8727480.1 Serine/threonine-protein kinase-like protein [Hibiscus syriacus]